MRSRRSALLLSSLLDVASLCAGVAVAASVREAQPPQLAVSLTGLNPGTAHDRALCLAFGLVRGMASECADLRVTHGLPATMSKGAVQAPTLLSYAIRTSRSRTSRESRARLPMTSTGHTLALLAAPERFGWDVTPSSRRGGRDDTRGVDPR